MNDVLTVVTYGLIIALLNLPEFLCTCVNPNCEGIVNGFTAKSTLFIAPLLITVFIHQTFLSITRKKQGVNKAHAPPGFTKSKGTFFSIGIGG